jgi:hypothetical protein
MSSARSSSSTNLSHSALFLVSRSPACTRSACELLQKAHSGNGQANPTSPAPQPGMALSPAQAQQQGLAPPMQAGTQGMPATAGVVAQPGAAQRTKDPSPSDLPFGLSLC